MKKRLIILLLTGFAAFSCNDMDLNPLSEASSDSWYTTGEGIELGVKYLFSNEFWNSDLNDETWQIWPDDWTDDWTNRTNVSEITGGTINSQSGIVTETWKHAYTCISNANTVLQKIEEFPGEMEEARRNKYMALARFARAYQYSKLIFYFGDVPYYEQILDIEEAFTLSRTNKNEILQKIYADYDFAASVLPVEYEDSDLKYATKGAALGFKARVALHMSDWTVVRDATKACMDLGVYELLPDFGNVVVEKNSLETLYAVPRSAELGVVVNYRKADQPRVRNAGGTDYVNPSWELFCSFLCTDGLPIDESPLYDPQNPFENRDPRCTETIVEFGTRHQGYIYQPHPDSLTVYSFNTGAYVKNFDTRANTQHAAHNGLVWKKGIVDEYWSDENTVDPDDIILRFADILLMYAEAKIELGEIDQSVLDAMNKVRARAYGVDYTETGSYPAITDDGQSELRRVVRLERRWEFAFEGLRYFDIIRWRLAEKVLNNHPIYGMLDVPELRAKIVNTGLWFFPDTPPIDEDGVADFSAMYNAGLIKLLATRRFDASKQYLWPIPASEILINENITQNPGY